MSRIQSTDRGYYWRISAELEGCSSALLLLERSALVSSSSHPSDPRALPVIPTGSGSASPPPSFSSYPHEANENCW